MAAIVSSFHSDLTGAMWESARGELQAAGVREENLFAVWVPGSFELALAAQRTARRSDVDAVLCLGLILKGETSHDEYIAQAAAQGIARVGLETDKPVLFGVLTCESLRQARERALPEDQGGRLNKGREVARAAIELLAALQEIDAGATREETIR